MSQRPNPRQKLRPRPQKPYRSNRAPIAYIIIVAVIVFSLILAGLSTIDWSGILGGNEEPTPDYTVDRIAMQQTVVAENPDDTAGRVLLADMLANSNRMPEAITIYEQLLEQDPDNAEIRLSFAQGLQKNDMRQDAEAQFLKVLELEPGNHTAHYYLARLYMDWQPRRQEEAISHFQRVIEIAPDSFLAEQSQGVIDTIGQSTPVPSPRAIP